MKIKLEKHITIEQISSWIRMGYWMDKGCSFEFIKMEAFITTENTILIDGILAANKKPINK